MKTIQETIETLVLTPELEELLDAVKTFVADYEEAQAVYEANEDESEDKELYIEAHQLENKMVDEQIGFVAAIAKHAQAVSGLNMVDEDDEVLDEVYGEVQDAVYTRFQF